MSSQVLGTIEPKMTRAVEVLERDLQGIRTGRASTALVERILVEYYGTATFTAHYDSYFGGYVGQSSGIDVTIETQRP